MDSKGAGSLGYYVSFDQGIVNIRDELKEVQESSF